MAWLDQWKYRKQFSVSRASGAVTDYQMKIEIGQNSNCVRNDGFIQEWYTQPYTVSATTVNSVSNSILNITSTSADPWIEMYSIGSFNPSSYTHIVMKYRVVSGIGNETMVFFLNSRRTSPNGDQRVTGYLNNDGNWHTMLINGSAHIFWNNSNITGFRLDYTDASSHRLEIDYVGLVGLVNTNCNNEFSGFIQDWYTQPYVTYQTTVNSCSNSILNITSTGIDPQINMSSLGSFNPVTYTHFVMKYRVISGTGSYTDLFFLNSRRTEANGDQHIIEYLNNDGNWHIMLINGSLHQYWNHSNITGFRLDYTNTSNHRLEIDYVGLVNVNNTNKCLVPFNDLRFTNESGTVLSHWIEKIHGESPNLTATTWVKFDNITTSGSNFYMYYGNAEAPSISNGSNTFIKFEDFEWGSNGTDLNTSSGSITWTRSGSNPATISTEKYYKGTRSGKLIGATSHTYYYFNQELTDNIAFSLWFYKETAVPNGPNIVIGNAAGTRDAGFWVNANELVSDANSTSTGYSITPDVWQKVECYNMNLTTGKYDIKINNSLIKTNANMATAVAVFRFLNASTTAGHDVWGDEIIVRHYRSVEPVFGIFGNEEEYIFGRTSWDKYIYKGFESQKIYLGEYLIYE